VIVSAVIRPPTKTARAPRTPRFLARGLVLWGLAMAALMAAVFAQMAFGEPAGLTVYFFLVQDCVAAGVCLALLAVLYLVPPPALSLPAAGSDWRAALALTGAVLAVAALGSRLIFDGYALSMDEFMAVFDAAIFRAGHWTAQVPAVWRDYAPALQPIFVLYAPDHAQWISGYEPMNAALLALGSLIGAERLVEPALAGLAILATYGAARRLWPEQRQTAIVAALLLATSSQVLVTAMTPYAMTAHLALNMAWLWLLLRGGRLGHGLAPAVAFVATGLHQIVFHPLFAAPFVLELWLARRWKAAAWHSCAYAAIGAFWMAYPGLLAHHMATGQQAAAVASQTNVAARAAGLIAAFDANGFGLMAQNLVRLFTWQSLLTVPLALTALAAAVRAKGMLRAMVVGLALTTAAMFLLLPYQGHGWGYRYLHGLLGTLCLLAAWGWTRLTEDLDPAARRAAQAVFAAAAAASVLILLPLRAWQAHSFEHPYAVAERAIQATDADVVLVDGEGVWFGVDLVRNDPLWAHRPVVLSLNRLSASQIAGLCGHLRVSVFGPAQAHAAGISVTQAARTSTTRRVCDGG
jgi:hypothetical protein